MTTVKKLKKFQQYSVGRQALQTFEVLSAGQLLRLGINPNLFPGITENVRVTKDHFSERELTFHALKENKLRYRSGADLAHIAGTAEIGLILGVQPGDDFRVNPRRNVPHLPFPCDATWHRDGPFERPIYLEYDSGTYSRPKIKEKVDGLKAHPDARMVMGFSSELRRGRLVSDYLRIDLTVLALWWEGPEERAQSLAGTGGHLASGRNARGLKKQEGRVSRFLHR